MSSSPPRDTSKPGILYVFGVEGVELVKIGYTRRQDKRGMQHRIGDRPAYVPEDLHAKLRADGQLLHVEEFGPSEVVEAETAFHRALAPFRCKQVDGKRNSGRREWYLVEPARAIEALVQVSRSRP